MRILIFAFSRSSFGHVTRMTSLAGAALADGHDVAIAAHETAGPAIRAAGIEHIPIREIAPDLRWRSISGAEAFREFVQARQASPDYVTQSLEDESAVIAQYRPDVVISDMRNTAGVAARVHSVPSVSVHNIRLFLHPLNVVLPELDATLARIGIPEAARTGTLGDVLAIPSTGGLDPLTDLPPTSAALIMGTVPEIRHLGPLFPDHARMVSLAHERASGGRRQGMVVTLGGSGAGATDIERVLDATRDLRIETTVVLGSVSDETRGWLGGDPRWPMATFVEHRPDLPELLSRSQVVVTHGGHGSMLEAIALGVPALFLPHAPEQVGNALAAARLGLGSVVSPDATPASIRDMVTALVTESAEPSPHHSRSLLAADGASELVAVARRLAGAQPDEQATL
jgi:UDP:flavonoid glycosyltransferase YjiC (YdhE family)